MLHHGLYEQVINHQLNSELAEIPEARKAIAPIDKAEASKVLAQYLADVVQKGLDNVADKGGDLSAQIVLTNQIVDLIQNTTKEADFASLGADQRAEQLLFRDFTTLPPCAGRGRNSGICQPRGKTHCAGVEPDRRCGRCGSSFVLYPG